MLLLVLVMGIEVYIGFPRNIGEKYTSASIYRYIYIYIIHMYIYMCCPLWCTTNETMAHIISNPLGLGFGVEVQDLMLDKLHIIPMSRIWDFGDWD